MKSVWEGQKRLERVSNSAATLGTSVAMFLIPEFHRLGVKPSSCHWRRWVGLSPVVAWDPSRAHRPMASHTAFWTSDVTSAP